MTTKVGAALARGPLLLFLGSHVLPDRPGWLRGLSDFYKSKERLGALGAKMLSEEDLVRYMPAWVFHDHPGSTFLGQNAILFGRVPALRSRQHCSHCAGSHRCLLNDRD